MLSLFFPPLCFSCEARLEEKSCLCQECLKKLKPLQPPWCSRCGITIPIEKESQLWCLSCHQNPPPCDRIRSVFVYDDPLRGLIQHWKFKDQPQISDFLGQAMVQFVRRHWLDRWWDVIVPVPLYPTRHRERDYNQALLLTQILSRNLRIPLSERVLYRIRPTLAQFSLKASERIQNLKGAFRADRMVLTGKRILVADDLYTTGATLNQCAVELKKQGALEVDGLTLARTLN